MNALVRRTALAIGLALVWATAGGVASAFARPALVVTISVKAKDRAALRSAIQDRLQPKLLAQTGGRGLAGYQVFVSRYPDAGVWDAMALLTFKDDAAFAEWTAASHGDGGLDPTTAALAETVVSTPTDIVRKASKPMPGPFPAYLIIPYEALAPTAEYVKYLDDYTLPQFAGWTKAGALDGYCVLISRYPAGRPWSATIMLRYRDDAALARRDEVVAEVRRELSANPVWKAVSDNKKAIRTEKALAVADLIAQGGAEP